jgi:hypothetical protein
MSKQSSQVIILCEDTQQETFVRRFLKIASRIEGKALRVVKNPSGKGSGEQFVRKQFPIELKTFRRRAAKAKTDLIVVIDADTSTISQINQKLNTACSEQNINERQKNERVSFIIPKRNIETWIHYLDGKITNEESVYPKLQIESDCQISVEHLYKICSDDKSQADFPDSLLDACREYKRIS